MRIITFIIALFSSFSSFNQGCIPLNIDSLGHEEALEAISHCKADSPFSYYAKSGDIYYKSGMNTKAIIAYENARSFNSANVQVNQNLITSYSNTNNAAKELIINDLNSKKHTFFNPKLANVWMVLSLIFWVVIILAFLRELRFKKPLPKPYMVAGLLALLFSILTFYSLESAQIGIVTSDDTGCKEFSSETAKNTSVLNSGYKLEVLESGPDWSKVKLATNKICWVRTGNLELIGE